VPGAFEITGNAVNLVCVRLDVDVIPARIDNATGVAAPVPKPGDPGVACVTLSPEVSAP
jgi:hypothetical protein